MSKRILTIYEEHIAPSRIKGKLRKQYGELERGTPARIAINPSQSEEEYLDTLIHELLHLVYETDDEDQVLTRAATISTVLWQYGYRRVKL